MHCTTFLLLLLALVTGGLAVPMREGIAFKRHLLQGCGKFSEAHYAELDSACSGASTSMVLDQVSSAADTCAQCTCATKAAAFLVRGNNDKSPCEVPEARAMTREVAYAMEEPNQCSAAVKGPVTAAMMAFCKKLLPRATILDAAAAKLRRGGGGFAGARVRDGGPGGSQPAAAANKAAGGAKPSPRPAAPSKPAPAGARGYAAAYAALLMRAPIKPVSKQPITACNPNGGRLCK